MVGSKLGALFVAVAFELAKKGLAWYVAAMPTYSSVYGAFATAPILLLWVYLDSDGVEYEMDAGPKGDRASVVIPV